jgi:Lon protease-like protein
MAREDGYPLFVLGMVLLPGEQTALHVFEPRYRDLTARCLENNESFGLVMIDENGHPSEFGCATKITEVIEEHDDGELDILVEGVAPIRLIEIEDRFKYPSAVVEQLEDAAPQPGDEQQATLARVAFTKLVEALGMDSFEPELVASMDSFTMAAQVNLDPADKQALLESREEGERFALLERVFAEAAHQAARARRLAGIAKNNGHNARNN